MAPGPDSWTSKPSPPGGQSRPVECEWGRAGLTPSPRWSSDSEQEQQSSPDPELCDLGRPKPRLRRSADTRGAGSRSRGPGQRMRRQPWQTAGAPSMVLCHLPPVSPGICYSAGLLACACLPPGGDPTAVHLDHLGQVLPAAALLPRPQAEACGSREAPTPPHSPSLCSPGPSREPLGLGPAARHGACPVWLQTGVHSIFPVAERGSWFALTPPSSVENTMTGATMLPHVIQGTVPRIPRRHAVSKSWAIAASQWHLIPRAHSAYLRASGSWDHAGEPSKAERMFSH